MPALQILIAADQFLNTLVGGMADETLSARAFRLEGTSPRWARFRKVLDRVFFWSKYHCYESYLSEFERKQLPSAYGKTPMPLPPNEGSPV